MTAGSSYLLDEERLGRAYDAHLFRRVLAYLRPYRRWVVLAVVLLFVSAGLQLAGPWATQQAIDRAIPNDDPGLLRWLALVFVGALALNFAVAFGQALLTAWIGQRVMFDIRRELFGHLQRLSIPYFDRHPVGRLMTRLTTDVESLNELLSSGVVTIFGDLFTLGAIVTMMAVMDWRLTLVAIAVIPMLFIVAMLFRRNVRVAYREIRTRLARINAFLQEHLSGMRVIQLFGREPATRKRFDEVNASHLEAHLRSIRIYAIFFPTVELLTSVALAFLLWYGGVRVFEGTVTVGVLAAFLQLTRRSFQPLQDLSEKYNILQSAMASSERVFALLDTAPGIVEPSRPHRLAVPIRGAIRFEDVWFRYNERGPWVLKGVSFGVEPGETVALVGHTGAGKTTVTNLLLRYYDVQQGRILLDGHDIRSLAIDDLRSVIGLVQQDLFLFTGDVLGNLTLGDERRVMRAKVAAEQVGVDRLIERFPGGWAFEVGERGQSMSIGERQLLAFARALAVDPAILVLDEATSSVDSETEARIQAALREVMRGRTSIVVAHRLSTILEATQILVFHRGEIRERGTHRALLEQDGYYRRLYQIQFARSLAEAS